MTVFKVDIILILQVRKLLCRLIDLAKVIQQVGDRNLVQCSLHYLNPATIISSYYYSCYLV